MKISLLAIITVILICACTENNPDEKEMARLCEVQRENVDKEILADLICSDLNIEAMKMFSVGEIIAILKTMDETPNDNHQVFIEKLNDYTELVEKTKCFQVMAIYDTDDQDVLGQCNAYRSAFD